MVSRRVAYRIPVFNIFYEILFDDYPTIEQVQSLMAAFALLDALLITMAGAEMNLLEPDTATFLRQRVETFTNEKKVLLISGEAINPYTQWLVYSCLALQLIQAALFTLLLMYLGMGTISFATKYTEHSVRGFGSWWKCTRWLIALIFVLTACGVALLMIAHCYLWAMQNGDTAERLADLIWFSDLGNYVFLLFLGVGCPISALSLGLCIRENTLDRLNKEYELNQHEPLGLFIRHIGKRLDKTDEQLDEISSKLEKEHWLSTVADLTAIGESNWLNLGIPMRLAVEIKQELMSEDIEQHTTRRSSSRMAVDLPAQSKEERPDQE